MKKRKATAILTLILAHLLVAFIAFTHVVGGLVMINGQAAGIGTFLAESVKILSTTFVPTDWGVLDQLLGFIIAVGALGIALVFAIVWIVRLIVYRRKWANVFSPILFFLSIFIAVYLISSHQIVEAAFDQGPSQIASVYWFVIGILIVVIGLHLLVVGLSSSGRVKVESILNDIDDEYVVVEEVVEPEAAEEVVEEVEPVVEEEKYEEEDLIVIKEEIIPGEKVSDSEPAEIDLSDAKLQALIRKLANEEIDKRPVPKKEVVVREVVVEKEKVVEPVREPEKVVTPPRVVREERVIEVVEEKPVVKKPVVVEKKAPVVVPAPVAPKAEKVERIPFPKRMQIVEDQVKVDYNDLKSYLLSYGLNSRVSNVADSFRQGRVLFAKLTNSGNSGLKLFLPIKPEDYPDSKIPLKSAEGLKQYEEVPTFIYIRSDLSMKRAKQLIDDIMIKNGVARKNDAVAVDHVKELA